MSSRRTYTLRRCSRCGESRSMRELENGSWVCYRCLRGDDMVLCELCGEYKPYQDYPRKGRWRLRYCQTCKDTSYEIRKTWGVELTTLARKKLLQKEVRSDNGRIILSLDKAVQLAMKGHVHPKRLKPDEQHLFLIICSGDWQILERSPQGGQDEK